MPLTAIGITAGVTIVAVWLHLVALAVLSGMLARTRLPGTLAMVLAVTGALCAHLAEIGLFAIGYAACLGLGDCGGLVTELELARTRWDLLHFSAVTYTSLGLGDLAPTGPLRILAGVEALTGLVLIACTASFAFIEMRTRWHPAAGE